MADPVDLGEELHDIAGRSIGSKAWCSLLRSLPASETPSSHQPLEARTGRDRDEGERLATTQRAEQSKWLVEQWMLQLAERRVLPCRMSCRLARREALSTDAPRERRRPSIAGSAANGLESCSLSQQVSYCSLLVNSPSLTSPPAPLLDLSVPPQVPLSVSNSLLGGHLSLSQLVYISTASQGTRLLLLRPAHRVHKPSATQVSSFPLPREDATSSS